MVGAIRTVQAYTSERMATARFGGNTSCLEIRTADNRCYIFDAGTGARVLVLVHDLHIRVLRSHVCRSGTAFDRSPNARGFGGCADSHCLWT
jgi:hypothetical protein